MRIVTHLDFLGLGGHLLSAMSTCVALQERGHEVAVAGDFDLLEPKLREAGLDLVRIPVGLDHPDGPVIFPPRFHAIAEDLDRVASDRRAEVLQLFHYSNLPAARRVALRRNIPVVFTICGGRPVEIVGIQGRETVVFSQEQADYYVEHGLLPTDRVHAIPQRVDMTLAEQTLPPLPPKVQAHLGAPGPTLLIITRLNRAKTPAVCHVIESLELLRSSFPSLRLLLVGTGSEASQVDEIVARHAGTIHEGLVIRLGRLVDAFRLVPHVDVVLGSGRCVFEAMIFRRPSLVVGSNGYAGTVDPETVDELAYFNFAGRNARHPVPVSSMAAKIHQLLEDPQLRRQLGEFGHHYAQSHLDMRLAPALYEKVYRLALERHARGYATEPDSLEQIEADDRELKRRFRRDHLRGTVRSLLSALSSRRFIDRWRQT